MNIDIDVDIDIWIYIWEIVTYSFMNIYRSRGRYKYMYVSVNYGMFKWIRESLPVQLICHTCEEVRSPHSNGTAWPTKIFPYGLKVKVWQASYIDHCGGKWVLDRVEDSPFFWGAETEIRIILGLEWSDRGIPVHQSIQIKKVTTSAHSSQVDRTLNVYKEV